MLEIGRICVKLAGRDAGKTAVIIDVLEEPYVLIDGEVRRKKCNIKHLEPLDKTVDIEKNATHAEVLKVLGLKEGKKKVKKEKASRPKQMKVQKVKEEKVKKVAKKKEEKK